MDTMETNDSYTFTLYMKQLKREDVTITPLASDFGVRVEIQRPSGEKEWKELPTEQRICLDQTQYEVTPYKIEIVLKKMYATPSTGSAVVKVTNLPKYTPANSKELLIEDEPDEEEKDFFKQIRKGADDDAIRAANKSYYESGGRVLNMNWEEVSKTDFRKHRDEH